jgi:hypothetical protein
MVPLVPVQRLSHFSCIFPGAVSVLPLKSAHKSFPTRRYEEEAVDEAPIESGEVGQANLTLPIHRDHGPHLSGPTLTPTSRGRKVEGATPRPVCVYSDAAATWSVIPS